MILSNVVFPEPLSPRIVRNSPCATSKEMVRRTGFAPKDLATLRTDNSAARSVVWREGVGAACVTVCMVFERLSPCCQRGELSSKTRRRTGYCAAFTSFQISLYFALRGTFCQK